jgi:hypothetical protein
MKKILIVLPLFLVLIGVSYMMTSRMESPPLPEITIDGVEIPVFQGSYCWGKLGCADTVGAKELLQGKEPVITSPGKKIEIRYKYSPQPLLINVTQISDDHSIKFELKDGGITAPLAKGRYYYSISASWESGEGTTSAFLIEIK